MFCAKTQTWTSLMLQNDGTYANWCQGCRDWHPTDNVLWLKEVKRGKTPTVQNVLSPRRSSKGGHPNRLDVISRFKPVERGET